MTLVGRKALMFRREPFAWNDEGSGGGAAAMRRGREARAKATWPGTTSVAIARSSPPARAGAQDVDREGGNTPPSPLLDLHPCDKTRDFCDPSGAEYPLTKTQPLRGMRQSVAPGYLRQAPRS